MTERSTTSGVPSPAEVPNWFPLLGVIFGGVTLLFFMALVIASLLAYEIPPSARFLVVCVLALGCGLSANFLGGTAVARGKLPLPEPFRSHPISFGVSGGVAVIVLVLLLGRFIYIEASPAQQGHHVSAFHLESTSRQAQGLAVDTDTLRLSWSSEGEPQDIQAALESVQTGRTTLWQNVSTEERELLFTPAVYHDVLAERDLGAFNRLRAVLRLKGQTVRSREFRVHVGFTVLVFVNADSGMMCFSALIDNSAIPDYSFEARAWARNPTRALSFGGRIHTPKTCYPIENMPDIRWDDMRVQYFGPDDARLARTMTLVDEQAMDEHSRRGAITPAAAQRGHSAEATKARQQIKGLLLSLGAQLEGLGHVMLTFGPPADKQIRLAKIDELFEDFDRMKGSLQNIGDEQLIAEILETVRTARHDVLPRARQVLDRHSSPEDRGHFGDSNFWGQVLAVEGELLKSSGQHLRELGRQSHE